MGRQKTRDVVVTVRNTGGSELVIEGARSACECFKATFDRKRIAPGQSAAMTVNIRTLKRRGETSDEVAAISNDPAGPKLLTVRFEVADELAAVPSRLHLGLARPGQTVRRRVKLVANVQADTKVLYAISTSEALLGRVLEPTLTKARPAVLEVVFTAPAKLGTHRERLTITTGHSPRPRASLPVVLCVSDAVTITPDRLDFGRVTRGQTVSRTLKIETGPETRLRSAAVRPDVLELDLSLPDDQGASPARLTLKKDAPYGPLAGELRLEFIGPEDYTLTVPFTAYVAEEEGP